MGVHFLKSQALGSANLSGLDCDCPTSLISNIFPLSVQEIIEDGESSEVKAVLNDERYQCFKVSDFTYIY